MKIGDVNIGDGRRVFIIAEASSNHGKDIKRAKKMIDVVAEAGADAVKFQLFKAEKISADTDDSRLLVRNKTFVDKPIKLIGFYKDNEFSRIWTPELFKYAKKKGIVFMATPFDVEAIDVLEKAGVAIYKNASYELLDVPLLRKMAKTKKPIILSTGMADLSDIEFAVRTIREAGGKDIVLLHCSSTYPVSPKNVNLNALKTMQTAFPDCIIGYSDHSLGIGVSIAAVALGAVVIEKHFMLDDGVHTVDDGFSLKPNELKQMVEAIRIIEQAMGATTKTPSAVEKKEKVLARRSLWIMKDMKKGERFSGKNVGVLRPGVGLSPMFYDLIIGKKAIINIKNGTPFAWKHVMK